MSSEFVFAGYLVIEPFLRGFPGREDFLLASIDLRDFHPDFESEKYEQVDGVCNPTRFQLALPDMAGYPGWSLNGFAIEQRWIPDLTVEGQAPPSSPPEQEVTFGYAAKYKRPEDGLVCVGYDVFDLSCSFLSIAHNCGFSVDDLMRLSEDTLNEFGLFRTPDAARTFITAARKEEPGEGHLEKPVILEVWAHPDAASEQAPGFGSRHGGMDAGGSPVVEQPALKTFLWGAIAPLLIASLVAVFATMRGPRRPFFEQTIPQVFPFAVMCVVYLVSYRKARMPVHAVRAACGTSFILMIAAISVYGSANSSSTGCLGFSFLLGGLLVFFTAFFWLSARSRLL